MRPPVKLIVVAGVAALSAAACYHDETKDSDRVGTFQTYAQFNVTARGSGPVSADVQLREGGAGGAALHLSSGDSLWFSSGRAVDHFEASDNIAEALTDAAEHVVRMEEQNTVDFDFLFLDFEIQDSPYYTADLDPVDDNRYYLGYLRDSKPNATGSHVSLPAAFDITAPLANETVNRNNDITVNWQTRDETVDEVTVTAALVCDGRTEDTITETVPQDPGTYTIGGGRFAGVTDRTCPLSIEVTKQRTGTLGPNLNGGEITGQRVATVTVSSTE